MTFLMNKPLTRFSLFLSSFFLLGSLNLYAEQLLATVKSPNQDLKFELLLGGTAFYQVKKGTEQLLSKSKLGIGTSVGDFTSNMTYESSATINVDETYTLPFGKKKEYANKYNELAAVFDCLGQKIRIVARVYNDGFAFKYEIDGLGNVAVASESSEFNIENLEKTWSQVYSKSYNEPFKESSWQDLECMRSTSLPMMAQAGKNYFLISEAENSGNYAHSRVKVGNEPGSMAFFINETVNTPIPLKTPWRVILIGTLPTIMESVTIENLNPVTKIQDLSWIKPGKGSWSYGGEDASNYLGFNLIKSYIDWTSEMNWDYFTLDRNWNKQKVNFTLKSVVDYAATKSIGIFVWLNQATLSSNEILMKSALKVYSDMGVKGVKVDFWESDSRLMMRKLETFLKVTSELKLLVNLNSCAKPTGSRKTWPHLLTTEAGLTGAYYASNPEWVTAKNNVNLTLIRNVIGPLDFSPVDFADKFGKVLSSTTYAHQMALAVAFESGIQNFIDAPENYRYSISNEFFKILPVAWDDLKCLEAEIDRYSTIARRKGDDWYVASICDSARVTDLSLSFLSKDVTYNAYIYKDGDCRSEIAFDYKEGMKSTDILSVSLLSKGGLTIHFSPSPNCPKPEYIKYEAESLTNKFGVGVLISTDTDSLCSGGKFVSKIGKPRSLTFQKVKVPESGDYVVTIFYMAATSRTAFVKINGDANTQKEYTFAPSGGNEGRGLAMKNIRVHLDANLENTLEIGNLSNYAPNIDRILVQPIKNTSSDNQNEKISNKMSSVYVLNKTIVIKSDCATGFRIYNLSGQLLKSGKFDSGMRVVPLLVSGVYMVQLDAGNQKSVEKVILF